MARHYIKKLKEKTDIQRATMGFSMFEFARSIVVASLKERNNDIDAWDIKKELFNRFYGLDFNLEKKEAILKHLRGESDEKNKII